MNLYQLRYFKTMAEVQHYRKASQILCVTQPTLSNAISALEDDLGAPLFERQGRNVVLSRIGRVFLTYVDNALDELNAGINKVKELSNDVLVPLNIGSTFAPAHSVQHIEITLTF
jgi:DNA-binding transcriptional LysR family regulator